METEIALFLISPPTQPPLKVYLGPNFTSLNLTLLISPKERFQPNKVTPKQNCSALNSFDPKVLDQKGFVSNLFFNPNFSDQQVFEPKISYTQIYF